MKREGRQHGMVRSYRILPSPFNPRPQLTPVNRFDCPPTAGMFTRVSHKPTNHSKFTDKCGVPKCAGCHLHPACKSKGKAKGTHKKLGSGDVSSRYGLVTWRVMDAKPGLRLSGFSASGILDHLGNDYMDHDYDIDNEDEVEEESGAVEIKNDGDDVVDDDDSMSFCDVGFWCEQMEGDEGWCLVGLGEE